MTLLQSGLAKSAAADVVTIDQSLRFNDGDTPYLQRTWSGGVDNGKNTWSFWFKRGTISTSQFPFWFGGATQGRTYCEFQSGDTFQVYTYQSSSVSGHIRTTQLFRDPTAWYHIVITIDTSLASGGDRMKLFVNGERVTALNVDTNPTQDQDCGMNGGNAYNLISSSEDGSHNPDGNPIDGYLAEFYFIQNSAYEADSFGQTDSATNQWKPIDASGLTFGTNGYYLKFASTALADSFTDSAEGHAVTAEGDAHTDTTIKKIGTASLQCDGTGDYLSVPDSSDWDIGTNFTAECWVYPTDTSGDRAWISQWESDSNTWYFRGESGNKVNFVMWSGGSAVVNFTTGTSVITADAWNHVALVKEGSDWEIFVDGTSEATLTDTDTDTFSGALAIGTVTRGTPQPMEGYMDEIRISNVARYTSAFTPSTTAFTTDENTMLLLHCDGADGGTTFTDSSERVGRHTITAVGDVTNTIAQKKVGDSSIFFDGSGDYLEIADSIDWAVGTGDFTIECWTNFTNSGADDSYDNIWRQGGTFQCARQQSTNDFYMFIGSNNGYSVGSLADGTWRHVAVCRDSGTIYGYVDGVSTFNFSDSTDVDNSDTVHIGSSDGGAAVWYIDEYRFSNNARYPGGTTFTPQTTEFTADANTKLLIHANYDGGLGADSSGNGNVFNVFNLVATDQVPDSPSNNFCTLSSIDSWQGTLSEGNLKIALAGGDKKYYPTLGMPSGKWYWEVRVDVVGNRNAIGVFDHTNSSLTTMATNFAYWQPGNTDEDSSGTINTSCPSFSAGDIMTLAFDADNQKLFLNKNAAPDVTGDGDFYGLASTTYFAGGSEPGGESGTNTFNYGQDSSFAGSETAQTNADDNDIGEFQYDVPTDYLALCTSNIPDPEIKLPGDNFNTVLYTGDASTRSITGVGFQPDFIWAKSRSDTRDHVASDSVRGVEDNISPNTTGAADDGATNAITSFDSDGWSMGSDGLWNANTETFVAWNWLAGTAPTADNSAGAGATPTAGSVKIDGSNLGSALAGSIAATRLSANTTSGFSIVEYVGTGSGATIAHGLSAAPELFILKRLAAGAWPVGSTVMGMNKYMQLNTSAAEATDTGPWNNTSPTASVWSVGADAGTNEDTYSYIAYLFHSVEGYSKVGSYTGNFNVDGAFIYTGFKPAFVMVKRIAGDNDWVITDSARSPYNAIYGRLWADLDNAEAIDSVDSDFVSNGFKLRVANNASNPSDSPMLYIAFAESPFKYSNAR